MHGWFLDHPEPLDAVLYCHGNGEDISFNLDLARLLRDELDAAVLLFDYRGYGKSEGKPHEAGVVADGLAAQRWLAERTGRSPRRTVLIGRSLGGGVATAVAAQQGAQALVLQSTFTRMTDAAASHYPWLPVHWLMRNRYDSLARLARLRRAGPHQPRRPGRGRPLRARPTALRRRPRRETLRPPGRPEPQSAATGRLLPGATRLPCGQP